MKISKLKPFITCLSAKFLVLATAQSSLPFTFHYPFFPPPRAFDPYSFQDRAGNRIGGFTALMPVEELDLGGTNGLWERLNDFSNQNPGQWEFVRADRDLEGTFEIEVYNACGVGTNCSAGNNGVGAEIALYFSPEGSDPVPDIIPFNNNLRWIQRVESNHDITAGHGVFENVLDVDFNSNRRNPYYYDYPKWRLEPFLGSVLPFDDNSYRDDPIESHLWKAELYLAEIVSKFGGTEKVKIHNGIKWGWVNVSFPVINVFSDSLASGQETDDFSVGGLTPGTSYMAWINNSLPSNQCNPNTSLWASSQDGSLYDSNNSPEGDGFASGLWGTVPDNGTIDLSVQAANGGARGEDEGNYELFVAMLDSEDLQSNVNPWDIISGGSGGGGIVTGSSGGGGIDISTPGRSQQNPLFPDSIDNEGWQTFNNVPGCRWYDPPIANTFEFVATDNTLFTEILDFPRGEDNLFTVVVDDMILGEYSPGDRVDFVSLLGRGISNFKITDIDYLVGSTEETYFPIQLAFDKNVGSFKMRMVEEEPKKKVPESNSIWGLIALGAFGLWKIRAWRNP